MFGEKWGDGENEEDGKIGKAGMIGDDGEKVV